MSEEIDWLPAEEEAALYLGRRGIPGDVINNASGHVGMGLGNREDWTEIQPALTYEGYLREKFGRDSRSQSNLDALVEAIMRRSNAELVTQYDGIIAEINRTIGAGVTTPNQVDQLRTLLDRLRTVVYGKR